MHKRTLEKTVKEASESFPVLLVTGPRQIGKTTLLEMCASSSRNYVTLDDFDARALAKTDPGLFIQTYPAPLIIDEVQYAPELFSYIKMAVDKKKSNGMYWLTGSQKFHLMKGISESLAGRVAVIDLLGFSMAELDGRKGRQSPFIPSEQWIQNPDFHGKTLTLQNIYRQIWQGSFPQINIDTKASTRQRFYSSYIRTYLQRDVRDILGVSNETAFLNFLRAVAARTGQLLNYADLARDVAIDNKTAKSWLSVLEVSGLVYLLQPYYRNVTKRLIKTPKLYFLDTGLCSYLTKWPTPQALESGAMSGAILETWFFSEILKSYWHNGMDAPLYFYRDTNQKEIDLLIEEGDTLYPVEFKKTATPSRTASKHFPVLQKLDKKIGHGAVICLVEKPVPLSAEVAAIPAGYL